MFIWLYNILKFRPSGQEGNSMKVMAKDVAFLTKEAIFQMAVPTKEANTNLADVQKIISEVNDTQKKSP